MSYKTYDKLTYEQLEGRRKWYVEFNNEAAAGFDRWIEDDATHWIGDDDAAFQAWTQVHDAKVFPLMLELEDLKAERDQFAASVERLTNMADNVRDLIMTLDADCFGSGHREDCPPWSIRDEVIDGMNKVLNEAQSIRQAQEGKE